MRKPKIVEQKKVVKIGNSMAVRITSDMATAAKLQEGDTIYVIPYEDGIIITKEKYKEGKTELQIANTLINEQISLI